MFSRIEVYVVSKVVNPEKWPTCQVRILTFPVHEAPLQVVSIQYLDETCTWDHNWDGLGWGTWAEYNPLSVSSSPHVAHYTRACARTLSKKETYIIL